MQTVVNHFRIKQKAQEVKDHERRKWFIAAREKQRVKEQRVDQAEDAVLDMVAAAVLADPAEIAEFRVKLDTYDEATVKALMENQALLDAVNANINDLLDRAHVIEDGRRVFKTRDGERVFDEHGSQLPHAVIHPDEIRNDAPKWEDLQDVRAERDQLRIERKEILEFQDKLDHARERSDANTLTQEEMGDLDADLADSAPASVAKHMPGFEAKADLKLREEFGAPSASPTNNAPSQSGPSAPAL